MLELGLKEELFAQGNSVLEQGEGDIFFLRVPFIVMWERAAVYEVDQHFK